MMVIKGGGLPPKHVYFQLAYYVIVSGAKAPSIYFKIFNIFFLS